MRIPSAVAVAAAALLPPAVVLVPRRSAAAEPDADRACAGFHSLFSPLPDACLDVIDTDRPHQTDTPHVVPAGHTQIESAVASVQLGGSLGAPPGQRSAHLVLFDDNYKFGLVSSVDVQLLFVHAAYVPAEGRLLAPGPLEVRAKFNIVEERGVVPAVTLVPAVFLPLAGSESLRAGPLVFWGW